MGAERREKSYLSNTAAFVSCVFRRVKDQYTLLHDSPLLEKACVRQVVLDDTGGVRWTVYRTPTRSPLSASMFRQRVSVYP